MRGTSFQAISHEDEEAESQVLALGAADTKRMSEVGYRENVEQETDQSYQVHIKSRISDFLLRGYEGGRGALQRPKLGGNRRRLLE